jgi:MtaA/CmuA family methyltransferase
MTSRERVLAMIAGNSVDRLPLMPITMMFAADQIKAKYRRYVLDHRVMVEAQVRTAERFDLDYVSAISDPAREASDLGAAVKLFENQPPAIDESRALLADKKRLARLKVPDPMKGERMADRVRAAALFRKRLGNAKIIEGWVEGPCAMGADLRGMNTLMYDYFDDPGFVGDLFAFATEMEVRFAGAQVQAGADLIGVGDAASSLVGPTIYAKFVWPWQKKLVDAVHALGAPVRLHICGDTRPNLELMGRLGCEIVDIDFMVPLAEARRKMGPRQVLLGNLDPVRTLRNGTPEGIKQALAACHKAAGRRYVVGAGCEVPRDTPAENLLAMRDFAHGTM